MVVQCPKLKVFDQGVSDHSMKIPSVDVKPDDVSVSDFRYQEV